MATIRKQPNGKWRAEVARLGKRTSKVFATKTEAKDWAARQEHLILTAADAPPDHGTFGQLMTRYADEVSVKKRGARWEQIRLARLCKDTIAAVNLAKLTPALFADWRERRLTQVSPASVAREMQLMSSVLNTGRREWGVIPSNPLSDVRKPSKPAPRDRLPTEAEIEAIRLTAGTDLTKTTARAFHAFVFAMETAMRAGEIVRLTWEHVDLERRVAHLPMTKNGRARDVPLSEAAVELIRQLPKADPVFGLTTHQADALFRKARDKAGVVGLHFHDSRAAATVALSKKVDVLDLARITGHLDIRVLMVYYRESAEDIAKKL